jgi:hypothetical protein
MGARDAATEQTFKVNEILCLQGVEAFRSGWEILLNGLWTI